MLDLVQLIIENYFDSTHSDITNDHKSKSKHTYMQSKQNQLYTSKHNCARIKQVPYKSVRPGWVKLQTD